MKFSLSISAVLLCLVATGCSAAPTNPALAAGACLADYNGTDSDRATLVECTEEHLFDVLGVVNWPDMASQVDASSAEEVFDDITGENPSVTGDLYWAWAIDACVGVMREVIGLDAEVEGKSADELDLIPADRWDMDVSLATREEFIAGDRTSLCSLTWRDADNDQTAIALPSGVTVRDMLTPSFPPELRNCHHRFPDADPSYPPADCREPHHGQYLVIFDGAVALGADWVESKDPEGGFDDYAPLDEYCTVLLEAVHPGVLDNPDWIVWSDDWGTLGWESYDGTADPNQQYPAYCGILGADDAQITGDVISGEASRTS